MPPLHIAMSSPYKPPLLPFKLVGLEFIITSAGIASAGVTSGSV
jgi:hypothetical protein